MTTPTKQEVFFIDCQLLQTKAWHRGMGKYTARALEAWFESDALMKTTPHVVLLFNSRLLYGDELKLFVEGLGGVETLFLELNVPNYDDLSSITHGQKNNTRILDEYIDQHYADYKVSFMITSLFLDEACPTFPTKGHKSLIYYDLIPLMYVKKYLGYGVSEQFFTRFSVLYQADMVFAISETVANDLTNFLGFPAERIINILGSSNQSAGSQHESKPNLPIDRPFIIMPTGGDPRKNNEFGVRAFDRFNKEHESGYQLVITSYFNDDQKRELHAICDSLVFSDNVTDDELWWLYAHSEGMLFPSEYEGLGMPVLEAMNADKLVACSDIAVFREISEDAYFMFSPYSLDEAVAALHKLIHADDHTRREKKKYYKEIQERYTWKNTASIIQRYMREGNKHTPTDTQSKPRIAIVCPHVCGVSEVGLWATNQYPVLSQSCDVDYYYEVSETNRIVRPSYLAFVTNVYNILELNDERYRQYDAIIYLYDGDERSSLTALAALGAPGIVVYGKDDFEETLNRLVKTGYMTGTHRNTTSLDTLRKQSRSFVDAVNTSEGKGRLSAAPSPLPYAQHRSYTGNRVVLAMTGESGDLENAQYIQTISSKIDTSRIEISVVSRAMISPDAREVIDVYPVEIGEKMTDHEYLSTLMRADLYVDCATEQSLERSIRIATAENLSVPTICVGRDGSAEQVLEKTYQWLTGQAIEVARPEAFASQTLDDIIRLAIEVSERESTSREKGN